MDFSEVLLWQRRTQRSRPPWLRAHPRQLLRDPEMGKLIVPIIPDEARTFGMEALFRIGIYSSVGRYTSRWTWTRALLQGGKDGQILEEGITEAGALWSFIAAGTSYATTASTPFRFLSTTRCSAAAGGRPVMGRGRSAYQAFSGRHGRPHHAGRRGSAAPGWQQPSAGLSGAEPVAYDPAFAYELAVIIQDGIRRMYVEQEASSTTSR